MSRNIILLNLAELFFFSNKYWQCVQTKITFPFQIIIIINAVMIIMSIKITNYK